MIARYLAGNRSSFAIRNLSLCIVSISARSFSIEGLSEANRGSLLLKLKIASGLPSQSIYSLLSLCHDLIPKSNLLPFGLKQRSPFWELNTLCSIFDSILRQELFQNIRSHHRRYFSSLFRPISLRDEVWCSSYFASYWRSCLWHWVPPPLSSYSAMFLWFSHKASPVFYWHSWAHRYTDPDCRFFWKHCFLSFPPFC